MAAAAVPVVGEERYYNLGDIFHIEKLIYLLQHITEIDIFNHTFKVEEKNQEFEVIDSGIPDYEYAFRCRPEIFINGRASGLYFNYEIIQRYKHDPRITYIIRELHVSIHLNPGYNQMHFKIGDSPSIIIYYEPVSHSFKIYEGHNRKLLDYIQRNMGGNPAFSEWMVRNISILLRQIGNIIVGHCEPIEKHLQAPGRSLTNPMNPAEYTFTGGSINTDKYYLKYLKYKKKYLQLKNRNS